MNDIMFMHQKRNETTRLIWITSHGQFIRSDQVPRGTSSLEQMRLLGHANTKQRCEIQSVWNAWIQRRTQAEQEKHCATRQSEGFSIYTSPLFTMDLL